MTAEPQHHGRTDRQTDGRLTIAIPCFAHSATCGKSEWRYLRVGGTAALLLQRQRREAPITTDGRPGAGSDRALPSKRLGVPQTQKSFAQNSHASRIPSGCLRWDPSHRLRQAPVLGELRVTPTSLSSPLIHQNHSSVNAAVVEPVFCVKLVYFYYSSFRSLKLWSLRYAFNVNTPRKP